MNSCIPYVLGLCCCVACSNAFHGSPSLSTSMQTRAKTISRSRSLTRVLTQPLLDSAMLPSHGLLSGMGPLLPVGVTSRYVLMAICSSKKIESTSSLVRLAPARRHSSWLCSARCISNAQDPSHGLIYREVKGLHTVHRSHGYRTKRSRLVSVVRMVSE